MSRLAFRRVVILLLLGIVCVVPATINAQATQSARTARRKDAITENAGKAADALFVRSDLPKARATARQAIASASRVPSNRRPAAVVDALFVEMEAAALQTDTHAELDAALRLCELVGTGDDPRVSIASSRILDLAGNTSEFRAVIHRIKAILNTYGTQSSNLRAALLAAAADGAPGISTLDLAHQSGLITDWRIVGPIGEFPNVAFEQTFDPQRDGVSRDKYNGRYIENFQFQTGEVNLPEYLTGDGVFYSAATVKLASTGKWLLRIESPGTIQAWVDGTLLLTKDDRFRSTPETVGVTTDLRAGTHHVVVKFLPSAIPFRVAFVPASRPPTTQSSAPISEPESAYVSAALAYWSGNYRPATDQLLELRKTHDSAIVDVLLAQSLVRSGGSTSDRVQLYDSALRLAPDTYAAKYELASLHFAQSELKSALDDASAVLARQPHFETAARLVAASASRLGLVDEARRAYATAIDLHPSCAELQDASAFFESISDFEAATNYEHKLQNCAPGSLAWPETLAKAGRHNEAATALNQIVATSPLDRSAREMLVRELTLAARTEQATKAAKELVAIAPNSFEFREIAATLQSGGEALDSPGTTASLFDDDHFYSPYRRNGVEVVNQTARRKFSGGPLAVLLNERIAEVKTNGTASVYVHKISRVLDRDGINRYGEVTVPKNASLLELRTVKADGSIVEPEFNEHKSTVSMPALAPGDAIDLEYVINNLEGGVANHPDLFQFTFGSFTAPTVFSRLIVLSPTDSNVRFQLAGTVPVVSVETSENTVIRTWEQNDIAQSTSENSMPRFGVLPSIKLLSPEDHGWSGVRDFYRDALIDAVHESSRVQKVAQEFSGSDEQRLRAAYNFVVSRIRRSDNDYESGEIPTADSTLADYSGSRSAALLAIAKELGITGKLFMAHNVSLHPPEIPTPNAYTHPLLVFELPGKGKVVLDPETSGMIFGGVAADLETRDALAVPIYQPGDSPLIAAIPSPLASDRSTAEGNVTFNENGDLTAHIEIRMGAARGAQMRTTLRTINPADRKRFFEQLASRIFPGVTSANGSVQNETNTDAQLTLVVDCQAARFADFSKPTTELDQLVPALGLKKMYATDGSRNTPLLIDTPLVETSTFRINLPTGTRFAPLFNDAHEQNEFGSYSLKFKRISPSSVEVQRAFDIPVQIIPQDRFAGFARFARLVDDAERQHLIIHRYGQEQARRGQN